MMKEIQRKKKVLIDLTNYGSLTAGFGQIAANYATAFSSMPVDDLHFVYLLRQKYMQEFGPNVTSVPVRRINKFFPFTLPKVDVWHAVNQQRKLLRIAGGTKFIFTIHDFNFLTEKKPWKAKMYLRRMQNKVNKAAVVTTISHYVADVIRQHVDLTTCSFSPTLCKTSKVCPPATFFTPSVFWISFKSSSVRPIVPSIFKSI